MSHFKIYIATSLDGFIAKNDGSVDWLEEIENPNQLDHGYTDFYSGIDAVVMGRNTYEEVRGFDVEWPYPDCRTFVLTRKDTIDFYSPKTELIHSVDIDSISKLRKASEKGIWIIGGGKVITAFLNQDVVDELIITIFPVILGNGIPLFGDHPKETRLKLINAESFDTGLVNLHYKVMAS